jgi:hypothetical protein
VYNALHGLAWFVGITGLTVLIRLMVLTGPMGSMELMERSRLIGFTVRMGLMGTLGPMWTMGLFGLWGLRAHGLHAYEDSVVHGFVAASVCILIVLVILWGSIRFGG